MINDKLLQNPIFSRANLPRSCREKNCNSLPKTSKLHLEGEDF